MRNSLYAMLSNQKRNSEDYPIRIKCEQDMDRERGLKIRSQESLKIIKITKTKTNRCFK